MTYQKKKTVSCMIILLCVLLAYICRMLRPENYLLRTLADQLRTCLYLGIYCAWVIYLNKHIVHKSMRQHLTAIGCMMVFWFFLRTVKYHIFKTPLGGHICWYLYYVPMILIPTLGLTATLLLEERDEKRIKRISAALLLPAVVLIVCVLTNDLHQQVFCFLMEPPYSDENYHNGKIFFVIQLWIIICLAAMEVILVFKSRIPGRKQFWLPIIPGILLLVWNIFNILRVPFVLSVAGDMTAVCLSQQFFRAASCAG